MQDIPGIRIGIMAVGDYCDQDKYVVDVFDLSRDRQQIIKYVNTVQSTGGGDAPEAYELALRKARHISWSKEGSVNKALVMIGDATPHPPSYTDQKYYWREEVEELAKLGVKIYGVQAGADAVAKFFYEQMGSGSGGVYLNLKKLPLITDMFLAVCYREFGTEHLETYKQEVAAEGRMNAEMTGMFSQLERQNSDLSEKDVDKNLCKEPWYHILYDKNPNYSYYYNASKDRFEMKPAGVWGGFTTTSATTTSAATTITKPKKETKKRKKDTEEGAEEKKEKLGPTPKAPKKASPKKPTPKKATPKKKSKKRRK